MYNPELTDRLLMTLGRQRGPAVDDSARRLITADAVRAFERQKQAENAQAQLDLDRERLAFQKGMGEKGLAQSAEQFAQNLDLRRQQQEFGAKRFDTDLALAREENQKNRRLADTAMLISGLGLGVKGYGAYKKSQRAKESQKAYDKVITQYDQKGDETSRLFADWLRSLRGLI